MIGDLPPGWAWTTLGDAFRWGSGGTPTSGRADFYGGNIPWVVIGDLTDGTVSATEKTITEAGLTSSSAKWVEEGSVLVAMYGSIGKLGIAARRLTTNQAIAFTDPRPIEARYLFWYLASIRDELVRLGKGGTQQNISQTVLKSVPFPLAPVEEQRRIVAALEEQLSDLDAAVFGLERARVNATRYLGAVIEQRVTHLLSENSSAVLKALVSVLDQGWSPKCDRVPASADEWGVIKTTAVQPLRFQPEANKRLPDTLTPRPALALRGGDLLITRAGPRSRVGVCCVVPADHGRLMNCDKVYRVRLNTDLARPEFVALILNAPTYIRRLDSMKSGISDSGLNLTQARFLDISVPLPPIEHKTAFSVTSQSSSHLLITHCAILKCNCLVQSACASRSCSARSQAVMFLRTRQMKTPLSF